MVCSSCARKCDRKLIRLKGTLSHRLFKKWVRREQEKREHSRYGLIRILMASIFGATS